MRRCTRQQEEQLHLVAALKGVSNTSIVTKLTELAGKLGKGDGLDKPVLLLRNMLAHDMEEALRVVRTYVALVSNVSFVKGTDVLAVDKDPTGESEDSKEASRALVRALTASCLGEELKGMIEAHNRTSEKSVTFDELTHWLHGEVGGKFPFTSYLDGLGGLLSGRAWNSDTFSMRLADLKLLGDKVASAIALYMDGHRPYLVSKWKAFFGEGSRAGDGGAEESESKMLDDDKFEKELEEEVEVWKRGEIRKMEEWERPGNFHLVIEKARRDAEEQVNRVALGLGEGDGKALKVEDVVGEYTVKLLGIANQKRTDLETKVRSKSNELRKARRARLGARASKQGGELRVSAEKLRYQEDDVVENLIVNRVMEWIELEGTEETRGLLMKPVYPARLTKRGRAQVYKRLLPSWIKKKLLFLSDKSGITLPMFEFALRTFFIRTEDTEDKKNSKNAKSSVKGSGKSVGGGVGRGLVASTPPTGGAASSARVTGVSSKNAITCKVLECKRHTVAAESLTAYLKLGQGMDKREEKRQKLVWLVGDARAHGFNEWVSTYQEAIKALPAPVAPSAGGQMGMGLSGKGGRQGKGGGRGGSVSRGGKGGKGGRGGGSTHTSQGPGAERSMRTNRPAPGHFKGMQSLTLSDTNHPPTPHANYPYPPMNPDMYHPFYNPYMSQHIPNTHPSPPQPSPTNLNTSVVEVDSEGAGEQKEWEESVGGWDEDGQVGTDVEEDPQHTSWSDSYNEYYGGSSRGEEYEDSYY